MKLIVILFSVLILGLGGWLFLRARQTPKSLANMPVPTMGATFGGHFVFARIFDPVPPLKRGTKYEDPLQQMLEERKLGEVTGGGTMQNKDGSIEFVGIDIELVNLDGALEATRGKLRELGAPRGSILEYQQNGQKHELPIHEK